MVFLKEKLDTENIQHLHFNNHSNNNNSCRLLQTFFMSGIT